MEALRRGSGRAAPSSPSGGVSGRGMANDFWRRMGAAGPSPPGGTALAAAAAWRVRPASDTMKSARVWET